MKAWVGITDHDWYQFLSEIPDLDEVNFWQPGGHRLFTTLQIGQPFLFKLHSPHNFIVGGGFFTHASLLLASVAWEAFGGKNGAGSFDEMRRRIERYRRVPADPRNDYTIGCILLQEPFFFPREQWISVPRDFHLNTQQGKSYDLTSSVGHTLWDEVLDRLRGRPHDVHPISLAERPMFGEPSLVRQRLGQGTFKIMIADTYQRRCAVTGEKALPVLEAAHIRPVAYGGIHRIDNGLLLRSDVHTLLDRGYVTVTPDYRFRVSRRLKNDFDNGEHYYQLNKTPVWVPPAAHARPSRESLEWHADTIFKK